MTSLLVAVFVLSVLFLIISDDHIGVCIYLKLSMDALAVLLMGIQTKTGATILKIGSLMLVFLSLLLTVLVVSSPTNREANGSGT